MATNPLSTDNLLKIMADALPTHLKDDTNSDISSSYEALALLAHACMVAVGCRTLGYGEGNKIGKSTVISDISPTADIWRRGRVAATSTPTFIEVEFIIRLTFLPIRTPTIVDGIRHQGGSTGKQS